MLGASTSAVVPGRAGAPRDDFLAALGSRLAGELAATGTRRTFARGHAIFHQGQPPDRVLVLLSGRVKVTTTTSAGREVVLAFRRPGDLIGELAVLAHTPRSATVSAVEPVEALSIRPEAFHAFVAAHPEVALLLIEMLSRRLRDSDAKRIEFSTFTTIQRVAARLLEFAERFGAEDATGIRIALPITQEELAGATGSSLESVGRALQTMRSLKCVETRRREIRILEPRALQDLLAVD